MRRAVYAEVIHVIQCQEFDFEKTLKRLREQFPLERPESLRSILSQEHQNQVKRTYAFQTSAGQRSAVYHEFTKLFNRVTDEDGDDGDDDPHHLQQQQLPEEGLIVQIARKRRFSPALIARAILTKILEKNGDDDGDNDNDNDNDNGWPDVNQLLKEPHLIQDGRLAREIWLATLKDKNYGVHSDHIKAAVGQEYERRLKRHLRALGVQYEDEGELRALPACCDKTPDVKLVVPICVGDSVVNWIESKAVFGDYENHVRHMNEQLFPYWNRYGPGLVIYWFGYVEDLELSVEHGILVRDDCPSLTELTLMNPLHEDVLRPLSPTSSSCGSGDDDDDDSRSSSDDGSSWDEEVAELERAASASASAATTLRAPGCPGLSGKVKAIRRRTKGAAASKAKKPATANEVSLIEQSLRKLTC